MKKQLDSMSVVPLPKADSGLQNSIVRLNNLHIDAKKLDSSRFFRREAVVIVNNDNQEKILRYVMGHSNLSIKKDELALDYDAVDCLGINVKDADSDLTVRKASFIEVLAWLCGHQDLSISISVRLGLIGAALGILGFATGVITMLV